MLNFTIPSLKILKVKVKVTIHGTIDRVLNPGFVCIFIPLFSYVIYPLFKKCNFLRTPLKKMVVGGMLAAVSFFMAAGMAILVENTLPVLPQSGEAQLRMYDITDCGYTFTSSHKNLPSGNIMDGYYEKKPININVASIMVNFTFNPTPKSCESRNYSLTINEKSAFGIYIKKDGISHYVDNIDKSKSGEPMVRTLISGNVNYLSYTHIKHDESITVIDGVLVKMPYPGKYEVSGFPGKEVSFKQGGTYSVIAKKDTQNFKVLEISAPNSIHLLWLLPQYAVITIAEIFFYVTGWEFAYEESPVSMKAVVSACFLLTSAFGNLIIVVIELIGSFEKQSNNFFLYASMMVVTMVIFMILSIRYKYVNEEYAGLSNGNRAQ